jgi:ABC-type microcin C transport system duplicated ATPase subunit YejF
VQVYDLGLKVEKVMDMMGFIPEDGVSPVSAFSGGWRMRIGLGKILLQDPNILLLDEPTNHLVSACCNVPYCARVFAMLFGLDVCAQCQLQCCKCQHVLYMHVCCSLSRVQVLLNAVSVHRQQL